MAHFGSDLQLRSTVAPDGGRALGRRRAHLAAVVAIADPAGSTSIDATHVAEVVQYGNLDRTEGGQRLQSITLVMTGTLGHSRTCNRWLSAGGLPGSAG